MKSIFKNHPKSPIALIWLSIPFLLLACGVKKPPTPAYSFPQDNRNAPLTPSPTPGFSNPTGPISEPSS